MKGVGNINDKKNIVMPPPSFITLTNNAYATLVEYDNDDSNDNNLSVLK